MYRGMAAGSAAGAAAPGSALASPVGLPASLASAFVATSLTCAPDVSLNPTAALVRPGAKLSSCARNPHAIVSSNTPISAFFIHSLSLTSRCLPSSPASVTKGTES